MGPWEARGFSRLVHLAIDYRCSFLQEPDRPGEGAKKQEWVTMGVQGAVGPGDCKPESTHTIDF